MRLSHKHSGLSALAALGVADSFGEGVPAPAPGIDKPADPGASGTRSRRRAALAWRGRKSRGARV